MGVAFVILSAVGFGASMFFRQMGLQSGKAPLLRGMMVNLPAINAALWSVRLVSRFLRPMTFDPTSRGLPGWLVGGVITTPGRFH